MLNLARAGRKRSQVDGATRTKYRFSKGHRIATLNHQAGRRSTPYVYMYIRVRFSFFLFN
jgi:hypothetical protein